MGKRSNKKTVNPVKINLINFSKWIQNIKIPDNRWIDNKNEKSESSLIFTIKKRLIEAKTKKIGIIKKIGIKKIEIEKIKTLLTIWKENVKRGRWYSRFIMIYNDNEN